MLPFRYAHWYVAVSLALTVAAFTPSYFSALPKAPWVHHLHGVTATLWIVLLITQNWSAHRGRWTLHGWSGMGSMALVPVFTVGGLLVTQYTLLKDTAFKAMFGEALSAADFFMSAAFVALYALALRHRNTPALHARYMLSTVILLASPALSRLLAFYVPGFLVRSQQTLPNFGRALHTSMALTAVFCVALIVRDFRKGEPIAPFCGALLATVGMWFAYYVIGYTEPYAAFARGFASLTAWQITSIALVTSTPAVVWGWRGPMTLERRTTPVAATGSAD